MGEITEWWKRQLDAVGQKFFDNPNGVQFVQADTVQTAKPPAPPEAAARPPGAAEALEAPMGWKPM